MPDPTSSSSPGGVHVGTFAPRQEDAGASPAAPTSRPTRNPDEARLSGESVDLCMVCEAKPFGPGDEAMCVECRQDFTDRCDTVTDPIEIVLNRHQRAVVSTPDRQICICLWAMDGGPALHRRHVAAAIYEVLDDDGPRPWIIGPKSGAQRAMEIAGAPPSGRQSDG